METAYASVETMHDDDLVAYTSNTYMCSISGVRSVPSSQMPPSPKQNENPDLANSARDVKLKWRREQISSHQDMEVEMTSSWQQNHTQVLWCGFLQKASAAPWRQPQTRWFEVRKEPSVPGSSAPPIVMQRRDDDDCALPAKRLAISDVRRHAGRERGRGQRERKRERRGREGGSASLSRLGLVTVQAWARPGPGSRLTKRGPIWARLTGPGLGWCCSKSARSMK